MPRLIHMDSVTKQLRFFKVLIVILVVVILAQFSFLVNVFGSPKSSETDHFKRVRVLEQPKKVLDPAVSAFIIAFF
jgi:hypothetical protein